MRFPTAVAAFVIAITLSGCTAAPAPIPQPQVTEKPTIKVELRDITSVVVVSGDVVANPHFLVNAPVAGRLSYVSRTGSLAAGTSIATVEGTTVATPALGTITQLLRTSSETIVKNSPIAEMAYAGFGITVKIPAEQLYRIYDAMPAIGKANVTGGPSGVSCTLVTTAAAAEEPPSPDDGYRPSICLLPLDAIVVAGLPSKVGLPTATRSQVLALPVSAVSGSAGQGEVSVAEGKTFRRVPVELGISDGAYVEILSGLTVDDRVLSQAPGVV